MLFASEIETVTTKDRVYSILFTFTNCSCFVGIIDKVLEGINCSVFAYGATGAGKTHTMLGTETCPGVMFHTMMALYRKIYDLKDEVTCDVAVSYLEVRRAYRHLTVRLKSISYLNCIPWKQKIKIA